MIKTSNALWRKLGLPFQGLTWSTILTMIKIVWLYNFKPPEPKMHLPILPMHQKSPNYTKITKLWIWNWFVPSQFQIIIKKLRHSWIKIPSHYSFFSKLIYRLKLSGHCLANHSLYLKPRNCCSCKNCFIIVFENRLLWGIVLILVVFPFAVDQNWMQFPCRRWLYLESDSRAQKCF